MSKVQQQVSSKYQRWWRGWPGPIDSQAGGYFPAPRLPDNRYNVLDEPSPVLGPRRGATPPGPGRRAAFLDRYLYLANINTQYHQYLQENTPEGSLTTHIYASTLG